MTVLLHPCDVTSGAQCKQCHQQGFLLTKSFVRNAVQNYKKNQAHTTASVRHSCICVTTANSSIRTGEHLCALTGGKAALAQRAAPHKQHLCYLQLGTWGGCTSECLCCTQPVHSLFQKKSRAVACSLRPVRVHQHLLMLTDCAARAAPIPEGRAVHYHPCPSSSFSTAVLP